MDVLCSMSRSTPGIRTAGARPFLFSPRLRTLALHTCQALSSELEQALCEPDSDNDSEGGHTGPENIPSSIMVYGSDPILSVPLNAEGENAHNRPSRLSWLCCRAMGVEKFISVPDLPPFRLQ